MAWNKVLLQRKNDASSQSYQITQSSDKTMYLHPKRYTYNSFQGLSHAYIPHTRINADLLLGPFVIHFSDIWIEMQWFSLNKRLRKYRENAPITSGSQMLFIPINQYTTVPTNQIGLWFLAGKKINNELVAWPWPELHVKVKQYSMTGTRLRNLVTHIYVDWMDRHCFKWWLIAFSVSTTPWSNGNFSLFAPLTSNKKILKLK